MTRRRALAAIAGLAAMASCAPRELQPGVPGSAAWTASLPPDSIQGAGDPTRAALIRAASAFNQPGGLAGRPADAARAIADVEYLAVELTGPRWVGMPLAASQLGGARPEWRAALGIPLTAPPQPIIDALYAARRALLAGQTDLAVASLPGSLFQPGGTAALARLANLPPLPQTAAAASLAEREATRMLFQPDRRRGIR